MTVTPQEVKDAVNAAYPDFSVVIDEKEPYLVTVYPPVSYTTEFEVEAWLREDSIELWCNAGYDPCDLPTYSKPSQVADALITFIEENESWAKIA